MNRKTKAQLTHEDWETFYRLVNTNFPDRDIGEAIGVSTHIVQRIRRDKNIPPYFKRKGEKPKKRRGKRRNALEIVMSLLGKRVRRDGDRLFLDGRPSDFRQCCLVVEAMGVKLPPNPWTRPIN